MKTLIIAGSNATDSINQVVAERLNEIVKDTTFIDLRKLNIPMYNRDMETNGQGFPTDITNLHQEMISYERIIICTPEYNGDFSGFFKNILDWISRIDHAFLKGIEIELVCASTGRLGGPSVREKGADVLKFLDAKSVKDYSIKSYDFVEDLDALLRSFDL